MEVETRNTGIGFREKSLEAESLWGRTVSSVFVEVILDPFQEPAFVLVERVEKGNLEGSVYYFQIVDSGVRWLLSRIAITFFILRYFFAVL